MSALKLDTAKVAIDIPLVRQLLTEQFPQWSDLPLRSFSSEGTDNTIFRLDTAMMVRLPHSPKAAKQVQKEQKWLPRLAPQLPLAIPQLLGKGYATKDYPWEWSVYKWLEGDIATASRLADFIEPRLISLTF